MRFGAPGAASMRVRAAAASALRREESADPFGHRMMHRTDDGGVVASTILHPLPMTTLGARFRQCAAGTSAILPSGSLLQRTRRASRLHMPKVSSVCLVLALAATPEHSGQEAMYLRLNDVLPPTAHQTASPRMAQPARPAAKRDGSHDFDFELGTWNVQNSRLLHPLSGSGE